MIPCPAAFRLTRFAQNVVRKGHFLPKIAEIRENIFFRGKTFSSRRTLVEVHAQVCDGKEYTAIPGLKMGWKWQAYGL